MKFLNIKKGDNMGKIRIKNGDHIPLSFERDEIVLKATAMEDYNSKDRKQLKEFISKIKIVGEIIIDKQAGGYVVKSIYFWQNKEIL